MKEGTPVVYAFVIIIIGLFYWGLNSHFIEIQEREILIKDLQETIIIQQRAIHLQQQKIDILLEYYLQQYNTPIPGESHPLHNRAI